MASNEETNAAGTDTRPPMLVENDYESWKIRIHRQAIAKEFGIMWKCLSKGISKTPSTKEGRSVLMSTNASCIGNESSHALLVRFHKLVNDMKDYYSA
ncbi:hypothetical protein Tco_1484349 [Tanacetum coccineum]